jgi:imidazolonepropionase-like amidohydrolase
MRQSLLPLAAWVALGGLALAQPAAKAKAAPPAAEPKAYAFTNARILPISGQPIERGTLVVQDGKIVAVGPAASTSVPAGAQKIDLNGKVIMPGLVDTHSHIGGGSGGDGSGPIQPDVRVWDSVDVRGAGLKRARAGGITTVNIMPGSGHLSSGQTIYLKLRDGSVLDDLAFPDGKGGFLGGLKMANGTNPRRENGTPGTRAKEAALMREQFIKAQEYRDKIRKAAGDKDKLPPRDLALEALVEVLEGTRTVHWHTHRHDDIVTAMRIAKEFNFKPVLQHVSEGYKVADEIKQAGLAASVIVIDTPGGKLELMDAAFKNADGLDKAGVLVGFHTDDSITDSRWFIRSAGLAVRGGMSREHALYAMTLAGARMLGLDKRTGSLDAGKDADFIIMSGDPLSVYTRVEQTWVEGRKVFDLSRPEDRLYAVGGFGAARDEMMHTEADEEDHR